MKEFLFRYRIELIILFTLLLYYLIAVLLVEFNGVDKLLYSIPLFIIFFLGAIFKKRPSDFYTETDNYFLTLKPNYTNGKCLAIISHSILNDNNTKSKGYKLYTNTLCDKFNKRNIIFFNKNISLFIQKKHGLKWACLKLKRKIKGKGKVQLLDFLIRIATIDKFLSIEELSVLRKVCKYVGIHYRTLDAVLARHNYQNEEDLNKQQTVKQYTAASKDRYYKILELDNTATLEEIKSAYRKLAKRYHPDKQIGKKANKEWAKKRFQEIQEAHDTLSLK